VSRTGERSGGRAWGNAEGCNLLRFAQVSKQWNRTVTYFHTLYLMDPDLVGNRPDAVVAHAADPDLVLQREAPSNSFSSKRKGRPSVAVRHAGAFHAIVLLATHLDKVSLKRLSFGRHVPLEKCDVVGVSACTWQLGCDLEGGVFVEYLLQDFKLLGLIQGSRSGLPELSSFEASTHRSALAGLLLPGGLSCSCISKPQMSNAFISLYLPIQNTILGLSCLSELIPYAE
jgi:hypothetical protein